MIHTYSLIHDDLPAMDDDDLRRGRPTLHRVCGENQAVLSGDLLLVEAFGTLLETPLGPGRVARMTGCLASAAGPGYLVGGQYMDMFHPEDAGPDWVERMIKGKTSALIRTSLELGTIAGGGDDRLLDYISVIGDRLGYLFQLTDDILDLDGDPSEMGKGVGKDSGQGKSNPVSLMGISRAREEALRMSEEISGELGRCDGDWKKVEALALYLPHRRK
jgi:geranylgeranyl pyrophosphate synthase